MIFFLLIVTLFDSDYTVEKEAIIEDVIRNYELCNNRELTIYHVDSYHIPECKYSGKIRN